jgi:hypothetical protein
VLARTKTLSNLSHRNTGVAGFQATKTSLSCRSEYTHDAITISMTKIVKRFHFKTFGSEQKAFQEVVAFKRKKYTSEGLIFESVQVKTEKD